MSQTSHGPSVWTPRLRLVGDDGDNEPRHTLRWVYQTLYLPQMSVVVSPLHLVQYEATLRVWEEFCESRGSPDLEIAAIRHAVLMAFRAWRMEHGRRGTAVAPATVNKDLRYLHALLQFAYRDEVLDRPARARFLRVAKEPPRCWSPEEFAALLNVAQRQTGTMAGVPRRLWWWSLLSAIWDTGRRRGTMLAASFDWLAGDYLWCRAAAQKERQGQACKLSRETLAAIRVIRQPARELIWRTPPRDPRYLVAELRELIAAAGLWQPLKPFHVLRSCHATYVKNASNLEGARQSLGHSSAAVTRAYIDPTKEVAPTGCDLMPRDASMRFDDRQLWLF